MLDKFIHSIKQKFPRENPDFDRNMKDYKECMQTALKIEGGHTGPKNKEVRAAFAYRDAAINADWAYNSTEIDTRRTEASTAVINAIENMLNYRKYLEKDNQQALDYVEQLKGKHTPSKKNNPQPVATKS